MDTIPPYTREDLNKRSFGFLIRAIICNEMDCRDELMSLDGQGSHYSSESESDITLIRKHIREKYEPKIRGLTEEIDYRINQLGD
ncbi:MAG: hypothetical protein NTU63_00095 [Candidatus Pacearchaeota archaeon]|nr:hypothetical protein [Candidatus Pacearchaeota archaeon]